MQLNFHYAAYSYLDEYLRVDKPCIDSIDQGTDKQAICEKLSEFAKAYNINRTMKANDELLRLASVYELLMKKPKPAIASLPSAVMEFASELGEKYRRKDDVDPPVLLSAATKFLWARYQHPVVIYDSLAWKRVKQNGNLKDSSTYGDFVCEWRRLFSEHERKAHAASLELINVKEFTLATNMKAEELHPIVTSGWFAERVFDHAIMNDVDERYRALISLQ